MDLNQYLQNFLDHYNHLISSGDDCELTAEFKTLKDGGTEILSNTQDYPRTVGNIAANRCKNRYKDIIPFDATRVKLKPHGDSDYINANYIRGVHGNKAYIASQAPLPHTVNDFWRMIWQTGVKVVLMACNEYEGRKLKCTRYWPEDDQDIQFEDICVILKSLDVKDGGDLLVRRLQVDKGAESRTVIQYHYTAWPDHGIPSNMVPILDMLASARAYQPTDDIPVVVHCSAGCGRTGTLIAVDYVWSLLKHNKVKEDVNVLKILLEMRKQRQSLVQTSDQYEVVYRAIIELFQRQIQADENMYVNISVEELKAKKDKFRQSIKKSADCAEEILSSLSIPDPSKQQNPGRSAPRPALLAASKDSETLARTASGPSRQGSEGRRYKGAEYVNTAVTGRFNSPNSSNQTATSSIAKVSRPDSLQSERPPTTPTPSAKVHSATIVLGSSPEPKEVKSPEAAQKPVNSKPPVPKVKPGSGSRLSLSRQAGTPSQPEQTELAKCFSEMKAKSFDSPQTPRKLQGSNWKSLGDSTAVSGPVYHLANDIAGGNTHAAASGSMYQLAGEISQTNTSEKPLPAETKSKSKQVELDDPYAYVDVGQLPRQYRVYSDSAPTEYSLQADIDTGETEYSLQEDEEEEIEAPPVPVKRYEELNSPAENSGKSLLGTVLNGSSKFPGSPTGTVTPSSTISSHSSSTSSMLSAKSFTASLFDKIKPKMKTSSWALSSASSSGVRRGSNVSVASPTSEIMFKGVNMGFPHRTKRVTQPGHAQIPFKR